MKNKVRWILIAVALVVVVVAGVASAEGTTVPVQTERVTRGPLEVTVSEEGRTRLRERFVVGAPLTGMLTRISLEEGERVAENDVLALLLPVPEGARDVRIARATVDASQARRRQLDAEVEAASARLAQLEREIERFRTLAGSGTISSADLERHELTVTTGRRDLEAARAALRAADAEVAGARAALVGTSPDHASAEAFAVRSPIEGVVLRVRERSERVVSAGTPLVEIGARESLELVVDVLSEDAVRIAPGAVVRVDEWGGEEVLVGSVRLVEPDAFTEVSALGVEEQRVNVIASFEDVPDALGSGFRVQAHVVTWASDDVVMVPSSALFRRASGWAVFAVEDGHAVLRTVELGHRSADAAEVLAGLEDGAEVVVFPTDDVADGVAVTPQSGD